MTFKLALSTSMTLLIFAFLLVAGGCSRTVNATPDLETTQVIVGDDLIGVRGASEEDQLNIDRTVARFCGVEVYSREKCEEHQSVSDAWLGRIREVLSMNVTS